MNTKNIINSGAYCIHCKEQQIEYGIENGGYWYYCHKCKKELTPHTEVIADINAKY